MQNFIMAFSWWLITCVPYECVLHLPAETEVTTFFPFSLPCLNLLGSSPCKTPDVKDTQISSDHISRYTLSSQLISGQSAGLIEQKPQSSFQILLLSWLKITCQDTGLIIKVY